LASVVFVEQLAAGMGTGGTICGTSKYLKEHNPNIVTVGLDTYGSVFKKYKETGILETIPEGVPYPDHGWKWVKVCLSTFAGGWNGRNI